MGHLEVVALHPSDAEHAQAGGADLVHACAFANGQARAIPPADASAIVRATDLPVRVTLRLSDGFSTQGGEFTRLVGLVSDYLSLGVDGFVFGFLTRDLEIDVDVCNALAESLVGAPWTFDRAFDHALEAARAWRRLRGMPGLDGIHTGGAALGMSAGLDDLLSLAAADAGFAAAAIAAGDVQPEHVPWLVRAGVGGLHLGSSVRPGGSWTKAHVDADFVRSWRRLLDDAVVVSSRGQGEAG